MLARRISIGLPQNCYTFRAIARSTNALGVAAHIDIRQNSSVKSEQLALFAERLWMSRFRISGGFSGHPDPHDAAPLRKVLSPTSKTGQFHLMFNGDASPERLQLGVARCILIRQAAPERTQFGIRR